MTDAASLISSLEAMASDAEREKYRRYFPDDPAAPFLGVRMGAVFDLAKTALDLDAAELERLLEEPAHEVRGGSRPAAPHSLRRAACPDDAAGGAARRDRAPPEGRAHAHPRDQVVGSVADSRPPSAGIAPSGARWRRRAPRSATPIEKASARKTATASIPIV